ncbi:MAG: hypothetical protein LBQ60_10805 [Bacteroidales bacterium]|jgi:hypothetical protein|nr:hypothetical protein [Bacteroidales bacterium]
MLQFSNSSKIMEPESIKKNVMSRKLSIIISIIVIAIAGVLVGCQKETETEGHVEVRKIDYSNLDQSVRLKSGSEDESNNKVLVGTYSISSGNPLQTIVLREVGTYELQFYSDGYSATANASMKLPDSPPFNMSNTWTGGSAPRTPDAYILTAFSQNSAFTVEYSSGAAGIVYLYRCK